MLGFTTIPSQHEDSEIVSVHPYPERRNHPRFDNISLTIAINWYMNGKDFTSTTASKPKKFIFKRKLLFRCWNKKKKNSCEGNWLFMKWPPISLCWALIRWCFQNGWSPSRFFKTAGVGVRSRNICCNYRLQCLLNNLNYNINCLQMITGHWQY